MENHNHPRPEEYLSLVNKIVNSIDVKLPEHWDREDVISYGVLGLMEAVQRYQPEKGIKFTTFASLRIKGAIMDALRKDAPVSRNRWGTIKKVTDAMENISNETGAEASIQEVAQKTGMSKAEIEEALESLKFFSHTSLEQTLGFNEENELTVKDTIEDKSEIKPEDYLLKQDKIDTLSAAISKINERHKLVLSLYFYEELNMKEIAEVMEITVSRVSQLKTSALASLRKKIQEEAL